MVPYTGCEILRGSAAHQKVSDILHETLTSSADHQIVLYNGYETLESFVDHHMGLDI